MPRVASGLSTGTRDHSGAFYQERKKNIFIAFFDDQFQSTALFKNTFLMLDLAGRRLVVILSNLVLVTWKKHGPNS